MNALLSKSSAPVLIDRGTFLPATSVAGLARNYETTHTTGALIHSGVETYAGRTPYINGFDSWGDMLNRDGLNPPPRSIFTMQNVDWRANLAPLRAMGFDYVAIIIHSEGGLMPWKPRFKSPYTSQRIINTRSSGFNAPYFGSEHYAVQDWTSEMNYVDKFVIACKELGLEYGFYFNSLASFPDCDGYFNKPEVPADLLEQIILYRCMLAQDMILRWGPRFVWVDGAAQNQFGGVPAGMIQRIYNAVKSADPKCFFMLNNLGDPTNGRWPSDGGSQELNINADPQPNFFTVNGVKYLMQREYVHSVWKDGRWYYVINPDGSSPNQFYDDIPEWQGHVNSAKLNGFPFLTGFGLTRTGELPPGLLSFLSQIDFSR